MHENYVQRFFTKLLQSDKSKKVSRKTLADLKKLLYIDDDVEKSLFLKLMCLHLGFDIALPLWGLMGEDFFLFLSLFEGKTITLPPYKVLNLILHDCKVAISANKAGVERTAKKYDMSVADVKSVVRRIEGMISLYEAQKQAKVNETEADCGTEEKTFS